MAATTNTTATEQEADFRIKLITYMNMKLDEECELDDLAQEPHSESDDNQEHPAGKRYTVGNYKITRIRDNICFIWTINSYFLVNLDTDLAHMRLFSNTTQFEGKLVKAVLGQLNSDDINSPRIRLLFEGQPEKSQSEVPRGRFDILAEPYYLRRDYLLDLSAIDMSYMNDSSDVYSYANWRMPEI